MLAAQRIGSVLPIAGTGTDTSVWSGPTYLRHRSAVMNSGTGSRVVTCNGIGAIGSSARTRPAAVSLRAVRRSTPRSAQARRTAYASRIATVTPVIRPKRVGTTASSSGSRTSSSHGPVAISRSHQEIRSPRESTAKNSPVAASARTITSRRSHTTMPTTSSDRLQPKNAFSSE